jgi:hypothetical protein
MLDLSELPKYQYCNNRPTIIIIIGLTGTQNGDGGMYVQNCDIGFTYVFFLFIIRK